MPIVTVKILPQFVFVQHTLYILQFIAKHVFSCTAWNWLVNEAGMFFLLKFALWWYNCKSHMVRPMIQDLISLLLEKTPQNIFKNLLSLNSKILGSYSRVFTVIRAHAAVKYTFLVVVPWWNELETDWQRKTRLICIYSKSDVVNVPFLTPIHLKTIILRLKIVGFLKKISLINILMKHLWNSPNSRQSNGFLNLKF